MTNMNKNNGADFVSNRRVDGKNQGYKKSSVVATANASDMLIVPPFIQTVSRRYSTGSFGGNRRSRGRVRRNRAGLSVITADRRAQERKGKKR